MSTLSERLTMARKAAGVSQENAARHLGISRPTYIAIEKGSRDVKPGELIVLASLFKTQVNRLVRPEAPTPSISPHLRGDISTTESDAGLNEAIDKLTAFVDDYQFLLEKANSRLVPVIVPPQIERSEISVDQLAGRIAQNERSKLGLGQREPIGNLRKTLDEVGVHVFVDALNSRLAGLYAYVPNFGYCILVNRLHPLDRMRWTIAHEYGHFLFDRDKPGVDYLSVPTRKSYSEQFADAFAANFLMPTEGVRRQFEDAKLRSGDVNVGDICRIADFYGVSLMATTLRMESMKLIRQGTWDFLRQSGVKVRDIKLEAGLKPEAMKPRIETFPERYILLAIQAWNSEEISTSQFAKLLRCSPIEARERAEIRSKSIIDTDDMEISVRLDKSVLGRGNATA